MKTALSKFANYLLQKYAISQSIGNEQLSPYLELVKSKNQELVNILDSKFGKNFDESSYKYLRRKVVTEGLRLFDQIFGSNFLSIADKFAYALGAGPSDVYEKVYHDLIHHMINPDSYKSFALYRDAPEYLGTLQDAVDEDLVTNVYSGLSGGMVPRYLSAMAKKSITPDASAAQVVAAYQTALNDLQNQLESNTNEQQKKIFKILFRRISLILAKYEAKAASVDQADVSNFRSEMVKEIYAIGRETAQTQFSTNELVSPDLATKFKQFTLKYLALLNRLNKEIQENW